MRKIGRVNVELEFTKNSLLAEYLCNYNFGTIFVDLIGFPFPFYNNKLTIYWRHNEEWGT